MAPFKSNRISFDVVQWIDGSGGRNLFIAVTSIGFFVSFFTFSLLDGYPYNYGQNLIGVFVAPFLCVLYLATIALTHNLNRTILAKALLSYCIQILPFTPLFFQEFRPTAADDFERYYLYAKNMLDHHTLWGGDRLFFPGVGNHYITQPGYRYFIFLELLAFRRLYRIVPFINIGIFIIIVFYYLQTIQYAIKSRDLQAGVLLLILLLTPYAIKNLLMGLPEWFTALLLMLAVYFDLVAKQRPAVLFILGLIPFFRQNLLITVLLLAIGLLAYSDKKVKGLICFLITLFLPVYHNLYYAEEWRFFVSIFNIPFLHYSPSGNVAAGIKYGFILKNVCHYLGFEITNESLEFSFIAIIFLPFALTLFFVLSRTLYSARRRLFFIALVLSAVVPVLFLGSSYYPRFEFVNVMVMLTAYLLIASDSSPVRENPSNVTMRGY